MGEKMDEENLKLPKGYKTYLIVLAIVALALIIPASREKIFSTFNLFGGGDKELKLVSEFNIDGTIVKADISGDRVIGSQERELSFLDYNGFEELKKTFDFKSLDVQFADEIYAWDKTSGQVEILDKSGKLIKELDLKSPFETLKEVNDKIYVYRKEDEKQTVNIIDKEGNLLKTHEEYMPILSAAMTDANDKYCISALNMEDGLKSLVSLYSLDDEELGYFELKDEIVAYTSFIKDKAVVATESKVYLLDDKDIKWEKKINSLRDIRVINKDIYLLYGDKFQVINQRGRVKKDIKLEGSFEKIRFTDEGVVLFGKRDLIIPNRKENTLDFTSKEDIIDVKYDDENLLLHKDGKIEIYNIKDKGDK